MTINKIIVHCSDSDFAHHDNIECIRHWHVNERGWSDIGYHFVILKNGVVRHGRPVWKKGAHCSGHNEGSLGICLTGKNSFSDRQKKALLKLVKELKVQFGIKSDSVYPHSHFDKSKTCPNFDIYNLE